MSLHHEKAAALTEILAATGEEIVWKRRTLQALVSDNPLIREAALFPQNTKPTELNPKTTKNSHSQWIKKRGRATGRIVRGLTGQVCRGLLYI